MREDFIARVLRSTKPTDHRLRDGWLYTCISFARQFQAHNACFDALQFLTLCDLPLADEKKWREKSNGTTIRRQ